jgi:hypothetical protein
MPFLSWDESCLGVLAWQRFVTRFADVIRDAPLGSSIPPWRIPNEFALLLPSCPARADSGSRDLVRSWQCAGAIAAIGGPSRGERPGDTSGFGHTYPGGGGHTCPGGIGNTRSCGIGNARSCGNAGPRGIGDPCSKPFSGSARRGRNPGGATARGRAGPDRGPLR